MSNPKDWVTYRSIPAQIRHTNNNKYVFLFILISFHHISEKIYYAFYIISRVWSYKTKYIYSSFLENFCNYLITIVC